MKKSYILYVLLILCLIGCNSLNKEVAENIQEKDVKKIEFEINRNVIAFRIAFNLINHDLPWEPRPNPVRKNISEYFFKYKNHKVIESIKAFDLDDAITGYLLHKKEFPAFGDKHDINEMKKTYSFFGLKDIEPKLDSLYVNLYDFYKVANVEAFIQDHLFYYQGAMEEMARVTSEYDMINQLEEYTNQFNDRYVLSPEPLFLTGATRGIGPSIRTDSISYAYQFVSPSNKINLSSVSTDSIAQFGYNDHEYMRRISIHEFGHTFVNPTFYQKEIADFINEREFLFTKEIQESLKNRGVGNFYAYMIEHVVRLLEIRIAEIYIGPNEAQNIRDENLNFIYLPKMEEKIIEQFETNRTKYPTYSSFIPELLKVIDE